MNWTQALTQEQLDANHLAGENYITWLMETLGKHGGNKNYMLAKAMCLQAAPSYQVGLQYYKDNRSKRVIMTSFQPLKDLPYEASQAYGDQ